MTPRTKPTHRRLKYPPDPIATVPDEASLGPAMRKLSPKYRQFVMELRHGPCGYGSEVRAARAAGFGTTKSTPVVMRAIAHKVLHHPDTQAALKEVGDKVIRAASFVAIANVERIASDPTHKDQLKANLALMDRGFPAQTQHSVTVAHVVDHNRQALEDLIQFRRLEVSRAKLEAIFGRDGLWRLEQQLDGPKLIEGAINGKSV